MAYRKLYKQCLIAMTGITVMISSMQGVVHCKAEDGHVGIKFASGACYGSSNIRASSATTVSFEEAFSPNTGNCGPCVDTPISVHLPRVSKKSNLTNHTLQVSPAITFAAISSCDFSKYQLAPELFATLNPTLACLRTIVLLT